jgi:hypothetical protein
LHTTANLVIDNKAMKLSYFKLGRYPRLALLLLMLAAQGIANAHEFGDSHAITSDSCATCTIGHGLGTAVSASHEAPQIEVYHALITNHVIISAAVSRTYSRLARAPPASL